MLSLYRKVAVEAGRRAVAAWPAALALPVYAIIVGAAAVALGPLGIIGGLLMVSIMGKVSLAKPAH